MRLEVVAPEVPVAVHAVHEIYLFCSFCDRFLLNAAGFRSLEFSALLGFLQGDDTGILRLLAHNFHRLLLFLLLDRMLGAIGIDADVLGARLLGGCGRRWLLLCYDSGSPFGLRHCYVLS